MPFELIIYIVAYILSSFAVIWLGTFIIRRMLKKHAEKSESFKKIILMVTVPKGVKAEESQNVESIDGIREKISVANTFFSTLGGMKAQKGWRAFWFGRNDDFSLEIVADKDQLISFYAAVPRVMHRYFEQQLHAQFKDAQIHEVEDYNIFEPNGVTVASVLSLKRQYLFPIQTYDKLEGDPLNAITNALSKMEKNEGAAIQFILRSATPEWHRTPAKVAQTMQQGKKLERAIKEVTGNIFTKTFIFFGRLWGKKKKAGQGIDAVTEREYRLSPMEEEVVKSLEDKTSHAGFNVSIRVVVDAPTKEQAIRKAENILHAFTQYSTYQFGNSFSFSKAKQDQHEIEKFIYRHFDDKHNMLLNSKEMASLWHPPLRTTETPNIRWLLAKKAVPPSNMPRDGVILGEVEYRGVKQLVRIKAEDRFRHMYIIGKSGSGKSVLLTQMAIQDIQQGEGVAVIDPHGDLIDDILPHIPKERADDVVIFNPADTDRPLGLNMLEFETDEQKDFAAQEMIAIFYKLFGQEMIGPMFEHYMRNAMLALMDDKEAGATIIEIPRMFTDEKFRKDKLKKVRNLIVKNFWEQEYEQSQAGQQAADMLSYVISKIGRFLTNDMMRNIMGQQKSGFDFKDVMNNRKILLCNLSKGTTGEVNSNLLGLIIVSKLQMAAMARASMPKSERKNFYLYADEFQNFITDSIATILSEARKYRFSMVMAHQYVTQLVVNNDTKVRDAVFGNVGTMIAFRIGVEDAEVIAKEFAPVFDQNDVVNVEQFTANIKLLIDNTASKAFNMKTIMPPKGNIKMAQTLKQLSRLKYGRDRAIVEAEIKERARLGELGGGGQTAPDSFF